MKEFNFDISASDSLKRVDVFLKDKITEKGISRTQLKKLISKGNVLINEKQIKPHQKIHDGDHVKVIYELPRAHSAGPENIPLDIIYEDEDVVIVNKQAGLVVHPAPGNYSGTLLNAVLFHCKQLSNVAGKFRMGIVHRLDKETSGLLIIAKNNPAHLNLQEQFKNKTVEKKYFALVSGVVELDNGIIDAPIGRHNLQRKKMDIKYVYGKNAQTRYKVIKRYKTFTSCEIQIFTGRTHQIRVHMASIGHAVVGDKIYGKSSGMSRQALHAKEIAFTHPGTGKKIKFSAEIPEDIKEFMNKEKAL